MHLIYLFCLLMNGEVFKITRQTHLQAYLTYQSLSEARGLGRISLKWFLQKADLLESDLQIESGLNRKKCISLWRRHQQALRPVLFFVIFTLGGRKHLNRRTMSKHLPGKASPVHRQTLPCRRDRDEAEPELLAGMTWGWRWGRIPSSGPRKLMLPVKWQNCFQAADAPHPAASKPPHPAQLCVPADRQALVPGLDTLTSTAQAQQGGRGLTCKSLGVCSKQRPDQIQEFSTWVKRSNTATVTCSHFNAGKLQRFLPEKVNLQDGAAG